jgi:hypothetical protein
MIKLREIFWIVLLGLAALPVPAAAADNGNALVITFKDGHQQSIPLKDVARIEFKSAEASAETQEPVSRASRKTFIGKWRAGTGDGREFEFTLEENGNASKNIGSPHGIWSWVNGEAHISWDDGWHDIVRKRGNKFEKIAFPRGFENHPEKPTEAHKLNPEPA